MFQVPSAFAGTDHPGMTTHGVCCIGQTSESLAYLDNRPGNILHSVCWMSTSSFSHGRRCTTHSTHSTHPTHPTHSTHSTQPQSDTPEPPLPYLNVTASGSLNTVNSVFPPARFLLFSAVPYLTAPSVALLEDKRNRGCVWVSGGHQTMRQCGQSTVAHRTHELLSNLIEDAMEGFP